MGQITWREVTVAWARPSEQHEFTAADVAAMGQGQLDRFRELSGDRARGFLAGRALVRTLVQSIRGSGEVLIDSRCDRCGGEHGRPRTAEVSLSVSHAGDLVVVAATAGVVSLGVDVEAEVAAGRVSELGSLFPERGAPDLAGWTRVEAAVKADGRGFEIDPSAVVLHDGPRDVHPRVWSAVLPGRATPIDVVTVSGPPGHVLSVALG
ncbi:4'-phosphopantetheinyl transferase family protein [Microbacterium phyllosphaerae]|uniref:4'-phosphopantetheinyl transferase family protein n=1 Tax=Microbacterium phyllosphaerae TaxID=124798 RepID=UPI002168023F|nr:hypothetical protein [Microbacterium phyllosphaerae]MCS3442279.1 4'-phosphopantetheinyl transferase [Microbacterium phyllosphaerae]